MINGKMNGNAGRFPSKKKNLKKPDLSVENDPKFNYKNNGIKYQGGYPTVN
jgi:hypothetical protein